MNNMKKLVWLLAALSAALLVETSPRDRARDEAERNLAQIEENRLMASCMVQARFYVSVVEHIANPTNEQLIPHASRIYDERRNAAVTYVKEPSPPIVVGRVPHY